MERISVTDWLNSRHRWPSHPSEKAWDETMRLARSRGWFFQPYSDHGFGRIVCRLPDDSYFCEIDIYSTALGTESVALQSRRKVQRCKCATQSIAKPVSIAEADSRLKKASALLDAVDKCLSSQDKRRYAKELLDEFDNQIIDINQEIDRAIAEEDAAESLLLAGSTIAQQLGAPFTESQDVSPGYPDPSLTLEAAEELVNSVVSAATSSPSEEWKIRLERGLTLKSRAEELRSRIQSLASN